ncbi:MAG: cysteine--tRNA ligase, partial [Planctomycetes bacterium]|nr:cysteine--tRNA ligase [Planctomycetota bacterium]
GKSLNNFITLKQAFLGAHERLTKSYEPLAVRQLILNSHYRSPIDFSDAALFAAQSGCEKITEIVKAVRKKVAAESEGEVDSGVVSQLEQLKAKFEEAMNDDLNTSIALSVMFELVRLANGLLEKGDTNSATFSVVDDLFSRLGGDCLGIVKDEYSQSGVADDAMVDELVGILIEQRNIARKQKDFAASDTIRDKLDEAGIVLEDKADQTVWRSK